MKSILDELFQESDQGSASITDYRQSSEYDEDDAPRLEIDMQTHASGLPAAVREALRFGNWPLAVQRAIDAGITDADRLTNILFFDAHPERWGRIISKSEPNFEQLRNEWLGYRNQFVLPIVKASGSKPGIPSGVTGSTAVPALKNIRRVWIHASANSVVGSGKSAAKARSDLCDLAPTDVVVGCGDSSFAQDAYKRNGNFKVYRKVKQNTLFQDALDEIRACGAAIHLFTWITPREKYVKGLADKMFELCAGAGARSLLLDAEGPWVSKQPVGKTYARFANEVVKPAFSGRPCCVGVTHITTLGENKWIFKRVRPLIQVCDYSLPQAYTRDQDKPGKLQRNSFSNWSSIGKTIVMGLWPGKSGAFNLSPAKMAEDLSAVDSLGSIEEVYYWWLPKFQRYRAGYEFIRKTSSVAQKVKPSLPPPYLCHIPWPLF
jgi:hypothetical protein